MILYEQDFTKLDRIKRLNIVNSLSGVRSAILIGSISDKGNTNLAIFNSLMHIGSNPPLLGFILRPETEVRRDTFSNILETNCFTINHVHQAFVQKAHYTSAKFETEISEFDACGFSEQYIDGFKAPFVKESQVKIGLEFTEQIPIPINGTSLIIGQIKWAMIADGVMDEEGQLDLSRVDDVGISGLNTYYSIKKIAKFPYARADQLPEFE
ncbi:MAG: flavin reductase [Saprospiraceae bacterium]|nr:flavin reductase [Saprospiraceae bacterium]